MCSPVALTSLVATRRGVASTLAAVAGLVVVLAGCGGSSAAKPTATPTVVLRQTPKPAGSGLITFGTGLSSSATKVVGPTRTIPVDKPLAWVATFKDKPGVSKVTITITQTSGPGLHPRTRYSATKSTSPSASTASGMLRVGQLNADKFTKNATFSVVYQVGSRKLATGVFKRLSCSNCGSSSGGTY